jgi:hypothetical protein
VFIADSLKLKFAPKLVARLLLKSCALLAGEENTSALAEAECLIKEKQPLGLAKPVRSRPTPDLLLNLLKLFYIRPGFKSSEKLCVYPAWTAPRRVRVGKEGRRRRPAQVLVNCGVASGSMGGEGPQNNTFFLCELRFDVAFEDADCGPAHFGS